MSVCPAEVFSPTTLRILTNEVSLDVKYDCVGFFWIFYNPAIYSAIMAEKPLFSALFWSFLVHFLVLFVKIRGVNVSETTLNFYTC